MWIRGAISVVAFGQLAIPPATGTGLNGIPVLLPSGAWQNGQTLVYSSALNAFIPGSATSVSQSTIFGVVNASINTTASYFAAGGSGAFTLSLATALPFAGVLKNFYVDVSANGSSAATLTFNLQTYNSPGGSVVSSALTVSYSSGATGAQSDTTHSISVTAGQWWNLKAVLGTGGTAGTVTAAYAAEYDN